MKPDEKMVADGASDGAPKERQGLVHATTDLLLSSTRALVEQVSRVGGAGAHAVVPEAVLSSASQLLESMRRAAQEVTQVGDELDIVMSEIRAKRLMIQAMTAELVVLDDQLEILERALAPLEVWSSQWSRMQHTLLHALDVPEPEAD